MKAKGIKSHLKVSVMLFTYNQEDYIADAIESVLAQKTDFPFEILISDDCSTDGTRPIVRKYARRHPDKIRLYLQKRNLNLDHFPTILAKCRGEYVALLEGDDYWVSSRKLQTQVDYLDKHPECSLCFHSVGVVCEDGATCELPDVFPPEGFRPISSTEDLIEQNFIHTASAVFRRTAMPRRPAWINALPLGDWPTWVLLSLRGCVGYVPGVMAIYRVHRKGTWSAQRTRALRGTVKMFEAFAKRLPKEFLPAVRRSANVFRFQLATHLAKLKDTQREESPLPEISVFQVFIPREGEYEESYSASREFRLESWQRIQVNLVRGIGDRSGPLRLDPGNKIGLVDIAAITIRSGATGKILWRLKTRAALAALTVGGTAAALPHERVFRVLSFGEDPQLFLPALTAADFNGPLILEAWVRLNTSPHVIIEALANDSSLREAEREIAQYADSCDKLQRQLDAQTTQLESLERDCTSAAEQLAAAETQIHQLRASALDQEQANARRSETIAFLEKTRGQLLKDAEEHSKAQRILEQDVALLQGRFEALKKERGELLRERGEQTRLLSRLEPEVASQKRELAQLRERLSAVSAQLEHDRSAMWKARARQADATARLLRHEQKLRQIQHSLPWKAVKPLWKLGRFFADEEPPVASRKIAWAIDTPVDWDNISEKLTITGWCFYPTGERIAGVRARIGRKNYLGQYGLERDDVVGAIGHSSVARHSGFTIECSIPSGPITVVVETIVQGEEWKVLLERKVGRSIAGEIHQAPSKNAPANEPDDDVGFEVATNRLTALLGRSPRPEVGKLPRFSVITPTYNTKARWLVDAARSLFSQTLPDWEWCIVDDGSTNPQTIRLLKSLVDLDSRLRIQFKENAGISSATNEAMRGARGEFVCFMDHDDWLAPDALALIWQKIKEGFDVVYSDEDKYDEVTEEFREAFHKPDWSPEYLRSVMYVGHLLAVRRTIAQQVGFDKSFDGVQDFEFMLRVGETGARIGHVPKILYHWRKVPGSIAAESGAKPGIDLLQKKAVDAHLARLQLPAEAEIHGKHRLRMVPRPKMQPPTIGIIIPTKDAPDLIGRCLESLYRLTTYPDYEVVVIDNGTTDPAALEIMRSYPIKRIESTGAFNFSRVNNLGSEHTSASYLVFLNNDTEVVTPQWLEHLLYYAEQSDVGAAGPLLVYPNRTVQHAGVALGMRGTADHVMRGFPAGVDGYAGSLACAREVSAVTAACMMMSRQRFEEVGKFSELFSTIYQDVDLCLRLRARHLRIIYTPQAVLVHHESASRKSYYDMVDRMFLLDQWDSFIEQGDPYYNRNLDLVRGDYSMAARE